MACHKDPYPLQDIDHLIDGSSCYYMLRCIYAYYGYKKIKMDPFYVSRTTFMLNHNNYYYNGTPFILKNACATYQWLMDTVLPHKIGWKLEIYVDDMIIKIAEGNNNAINLEDVL